MYFSLNKELGFISVLLKRRKRSVTAHNIQNNWRNILPNGFLVEAETQWATIIEVFIRD